MITPNQFEWHRSDEDNADAACLHCGGCIQHEAWCSTQNINVRYAFQIAAHPEILSVQDDLILHALGVKWNSDLPRSWALNSARPLLPRQEAERQGANASWIYSD